ncbi:MAG: helix-turn-helix transcriptional regulator [Polyangiaceae bacterium]
MTTQDPLKVVELIEACYRLEAPEKEWLHGITDAAAPLLDRGKGVAAYLFDLRGSNGFQVLDGSFPEGIDLAGMRGFLSSVPVDFVKSVWLGTRCGYVSESDGFENMAPVLESACHAADVVALKGRDPTGFGIWLGTLLPKVSAATDTENAVFDRIATHLAASYRARRALGGAPLSLDESDAILTPDGHVEHARGEAENTESRNLLREATIGFDKAKTAAGRADPARALELWQGLVDARWSLIDHFDHDGRHYVVARRNDVKIEGLSDLSERERQVVAYAALGHDNKVVAYDLGLADSTVRVLLHRAAAKLNVKGREELIELFKKANGD